MWAYRFRTRLNQVPEVRILDLPQYPLHACQHRTAVGSVTAVQSLGSDPRDPWAATMSTRHNLSAVLATHASSESELVTSNSCVRTLRPASAPRIRTGSTSWPSGGYQPRATSAPASAKSIAVAAPMAEAAPVTSATQLLKSNIIQSAFALKRYRVDLD
jgi:hypothetical protein